MELDLISQANLNLINIGELRALGASIGVRAPSTLKKSELIEKIKAIITGKTEPELKKDNRGRPSKNRDISKFYEMGLTFDNIYNPSVSSVASQNDENAYITSFVDALSGFVISDKNGFKIKKYPYVDSPEDAFVSAGLARDYGLKDYDEVRYLLVNSNAQIKEVSKIISVNGASLSEPEIIFNRLNAIKCDAFEKYSVGGKSIRIFKGKRNIIFSNPAYDNNEGDGVCEEIAKKDNKLVIELSINKEVATNLNDKNIVSFNALAVDDPRKIETEINKAIICAKTGVSEGKQVYLIIDWFEALVDFMKNKSPNSSLVDLKRILFLANAYENNSSLTLIALSSGKIKDSENENLLEYFN